MKKKFVTAAKKKKISKEIAVEDEVVFERKNGKKFFSRCSPPYFKSAMRKLKTIVGKQQRSRINDTPFGKWIDMLVLAISSGRIDYLLDKFQVDSCCFIIVDDIRIPFRSSEFSIVIGLQHGGQPVDLDLKMDSRFLERHFDGKVTNANRATIYEKLLLLARSNDEGEIDDFVRFFILLIFNCIIFPTGNYITPSFIFPYLDDLTTFFKHAWGDAAFRFLYREIRHLGSKLYVDGCMVGLMAWLYEIVPTLGVRHSLNIYPRLFRWGKSKIPLTAADAESVFRCIDSTQVLSIQPLCDEEKLVDIKHALKSGDSLSEARRFEKIMIEQIDEIKLLKKRCVELEAGYVRFGSNGKGFVVEKYDNICNALDFNPRLRNC